MHLRVEYLFVALCGLVGVAHGLSCYYCSSDYITALSVGQAGAGVNKKCYSPDSTVNKHTCTGQCKTVFRTGGVVRYCASSCAAATSFTQDVTCCSTGNCNTNYPQGSGWVSCHKCVGTGKSGSCANKGFSADGNEEVCHGECYKTEAEANIIGIKTKSVTRGCSANCVPGSQSGGLSGIVSGKSETKCCPANKCNAGTIVSAVAGLLLVAVVVALGI